MTGMLGEFIHLIVLTLTTVMAVCYVPIIHTSTWCSTKYVNKVVEVVQKYYKICEYKALELVKLTLSVIQYCINWLKILACVEIVSTIGYSTILVANTCLLISANIEIFLINLLYFTGTLSKT